MCGLERCNSLNHISDTSSREEGETEKKQNAIDGFRGLNINFKDTNIFFHKSAHGISADKDNGNIIKKVDKDVKEIMEIERKDFFYYIETGL